MVIGGLMTNQVNNTVTKLPFLGDLPLIGSAFRYSNKQKNERELIIFLTPHIINGDVHVDPDEYTNSKLAVKGAKTYYDPLPKDESTVPVP